MSKFKIGEKVVTPDGFVAKVVSIGPDEYDDFYWCEVSPVDFETTVTREFKEMDLTPYN